MEALAVIVLSVFAVGLFTSMAGALNVTGLLSFTFCGCSLALAIVVLA